MPVFALEIKADLENVSKLRPLENNLWKLDISNSDSERKLGITVSAGDEIDIEGSRGIANFILKWPGSKQQSYIKIVRLEKCSGEYSGSDSGSFVRIVGFECRGLVIDRWIPTVDFEVETSSGVIIEGGADLSDGDWADFDDRANQSVSVINLEHRIVRL